MGSDRKHSLSSERRSRWESRHTDIDRGHANVDVKTEADNRVDCNQALFLMALLLSIGNASLHAIPQARTDVRLTRESHWAVYGVVGATR